MVGRALGIAEKDLHNDVGFSEPLGDLVYYTVHANIQYHSDRSPAQTLPLLGAPFHWTECPSELCQTRIYVSMMLW